MVIKLKRILVEAAGEKISNEYSGWFNAENGKFISFKDYTSNSFVALTKNYMQKKYPDNYKFIIRSSKKLNKGMNIIISRLIKFMENRRWFKMEIKSSDKKYIGEIICNFSISKLSNKINTILKEWYESFEIKKIYLLGSHNKEIGKFIKNYLKSNKMKIKLLIRE